MLHLPTIAGYLFAGMLLSPYAPGYDADVETLQELAELGVIFLMFGVGLHFNIADLMSVKGIAIPGAILQIAAATAIGAGIGGAFGLDIREGLILGLAISVASTVVLIRALEENGMLESIHGRVAVGWLIVEDLATVFFLVLLPALDPEANGNLLTETLLAVAKAAVFLTIMLVIGARVVPWLLGIVARSGSRELFILGVVAGALGIATGAAVFGLSVALGAFIAGVVISETETSHQAAADVLPLREAFAVLFFVSVGMLMDPQVIIDNPGLFLAVLAAVLFGKALVAVLVAAALPYPARTGLTVAVGLAQVGEFSFIVAQEGLDLGLMSPTTYNIILAVAVVSITVNPLAFASIPLVERILRSWDPVWQWADRQGAKLEGHVPRSDHVLIVGYGRVGELTGHALAQIGVPYTVIESNLPLARRLSAAGIPTLWGDAASLEVLEQAGARDARALVLAVPDESTTLLALANARKLNATVPIIVRAPNATEIPILRSLGATDVVVPEYEGGLEMMRQSLVSLGYDSEEALHFSHAVRDIHYNDPGHASS